MLEDIGHAVGVPKARRTKSRGPRWRPSNLRLGPGGPQDFSSFSILKIYDEYNTFHLSVCLLSLSMPFLILYSLPLSDKETQFLKLHDRFHFCISFHFLCQSWLSELKKDGFGDPILEATGPRRHPCVYFCRNQKCHQGPWQGHHQQGF